MATGDPGGGHRPQYDESQSDSPQSSQRPTRGRVGDLMKLFQGGGGDPGANSPASPNSRVKTGSTSVSPPGYQPSLPSVDQHISTQQDLATVVDLPPGKSGDQRHKQKPAVKPKTNPKPGLNSRPVSQGTGNEMGNPSPVQSTLGVTGAMAISRSTTTPLSAQDAAVEQSSHTAARDSPHQQDNSSDMAAATACNVMGGMSSSPDAAPQRQNYRPGPVSNNSAQQTSVGATVNVNSGGRTKQLSLPLPPAGNAAQTEQPAKNGRPMAQPEQHPPVPMTPTNVVDHSVVPALSPRGNEVPNQSRSITTNNTLSAGATTITSGVADQSSSPSSPRNTGSSGQRGQLSAIATETHTSVHSPSSRNGTMGQQQAKSNVTPTRQPITRQQANRAFATPVTNSSPSLTLNTSSSPPNIVCERCEEESAVYQCRDCPMDLCDACWKVQHKVKKWASHKKCQLSTNSDGQPSSNFGLGQLQRDEYVENNYLSKVFNTATHASPPGVSGTEPFQVFHLMKLHYDQQEQGDLVRKTLVDRKDIHQLSSFLGLRGSKASSWPIDKQFQNRELATIGVYGNKDRMADWLQQRTSLGAADVKMITDESRPGLYCLNNGGNVQYLVFNAPEDAFAAISRKNVNCLVIRCLVELCRPLLVFYNKDELSSFRALPNFNQEVEEKRINTSVMNCVPDTEPKVTLRPGFLVKVSDLDTGDSGPFLTWNNHFFHLGRSVERKTRYSDSKELTFSESTAPEALSAVIPKLKTLSDKGAKGDGDLYFSQHDLEKAQMKGENLSHGTPLNDQLVSQVRDTVTLFIMENCPLAFWFLDTNQPHVEKHRLEDSQKKLMASIEKANRDANSDFHVAPDEELQQFLPQLKNMELGHGMYLVKLDQDGIPAEQESLQTMSAFICDSGRMQGDELNSHFMQLFNTNDPSQEEDNAVELKTILIRAMEKRDNVARSPLSYGQPDIFQIASCKEFVADVFTRMVQALASKCPELKPEHGKLRALYNAAKKIVASSLQSPDLEYEKRLEVLSTAIEKIRRYLCTDVSLGLILEEMTFDSTDTTLNIKYKVEQIPRCESIRQLYSLVVPDAERNPSCVKPKKQPLALPLQAQQTVLFLTVLKKTGKVLAVIRTASKKECNIFVLHQNNFTYQPAGEPIYPMERQVDMVGFEEKTRLMAVHQPEEMAIAFITFSEKFLSASCNYSFRYDQCMPNVVQQLLFAPGAQKLCVLFDNFTCYIYDIQHQILKDRPIEIKVPIIKAAMTTPGGSHLLIATSKAEDQHRISGVTGSSTVSHDGSGQYDSRILIYSIEARRQVSELSLPASSIPPSCLDSLQLMLIGSQTYLVALDKVSGTLRSSLTSIKDDAAVTVENCYVGPTPDGLSTSPETPRPWNYLDYLYFIYDKFCIEDNFKFCRRLVDVCCIVDDDVGDTFDSQLCDKYVDNLLQSLDVSCHKPRKNFRLTPECVVFSATLLPQLAHTGTSVLKWLRRMVCLLPIQVARADSNKLSILQSGVESKHIVLSKNLLDVYNAIRLGLYDDILRKVPGQVKVISSMGMQSTGKSYLMNHAFGAMFDIAGHRCTKGIWMTMRITEDRLYVILDFEGLGSVERSSQEDTLLSVMNAAVSGLTVYRAPWSFSKSALDTFKKFGKGVDVFKDVPMELFRGWFYLAIRDVNYGDCEEVAAEYNDKLKLILGMDSTNNFLTRLYNSQRVVHSLPIFKDPLFYRHLDRIVAHLQSELTPHWECGVDFLDLFRQALAKVHCGAFGGWEETIISVKLYNIERCLDCALAHGRINESESLVDDKGKPIPDETIHCGSGSSVEDFQDESLSLQSGIGFADLIKQFKEKFENSSEARIDSDDVREWTNRFLNFLTAVHDRRVRRVKAWARSHLAGYTDVRIDNLWTDITKRLTYNPLALCALSCGTNRCQCPCLKQQQHHSSDAHDCFGDHKCHRPCLYCSEGHTSGNSINAGSGTCLLAAGHGGNHDCKEHTCGSPCWMSEWEGCLGYCKKRLGHGEHDEHDTDHECREIHLCNKTCDADHCRRKCKTRLLSPANAAILHRHDCGAERCLHPCVMCDKRLSCGEEDCGPCRTCSKRMCTNTCASESHFHQPDRTEAHFCGSAHPCPKPCNVPNSCGFGYKDEHIDPQTAAFVDEGRGGERVGVHVLKRHECGIDIPPKQFQHSSPDVHNCGQRNHFCGEPCPLCQKRCGRSIARTSAGHYTHAGKHSVDHGYMWKTVMASAQLDFNIGGTEYRRGQRAGDGLRCDMYCEKLGRGHTHLVKCVCNTTLSESDRRHCADNIKFSDDDTVPKDELKHDAYWEYVNFENPTRSNADLASFKLCNWKCASTLHDETMWCQLELWHGDSEQGDRRLQGHVLPDQCDHPSIHHVLLLDHSSSMSAPSPMPDDRDICASHPNRLGAALQCALLYLKNRRQCAYDDIFTVIDFNHEVSEPAEEIRGRFDISSLSGKLKRLKASGGTNFTEAFLAAIKAFKKHEELSHRPVLLFITDGEDSGFDGDIFKNYLENRSARNLKSIMVHTVRISPNPLPIFQKIVDIAAKGVYRACEFARASSCETMMSMDALSNHHDQLSVTAVPRGGFMSASIVTGPGHRFS
eukprot:scpid3738/ scgid0752/ 